MHIVSVINYKGGVGKTSLTANLAAELVQIFQIYDRWFFFEGSQTAHCDAENTSPDIFDHQGVL